MLRSPLLSPHTYYVPTYTSTETEPVYSINPLWHLAFLLTLPNLLLLLFFSEPSIIILVTTSTFFWSFRAVVLLADLFDCWVHPASPPRLVTLRHTSPRPTASETRPAPR